MQQPTLTQLVEGLNYRLRRREAKAPRDYFHAGASLVGRHIETWTHSYHRAQKLTKVEAIAYLETLA